MTDIHNLLKTMELLCKEFPTEYNDRINVELDFHGIGDRCCLFVMTYSEELGDKQYDIRESGDDKVFVHEFTRNPDYSLFDDPDLAWRLCSMDQMTPEEAVKEILSGIIVDEEH